MRVNAYGVQSSRFQFLKNIWPERWNWQSESMKLSRAETKVSMTLDGNRILLTEEIFSALSESDYSCQIERHLSFCGLWSGLPWYGGDIVRKRKETQAH